jgi:ABC-type spermidine/putrescine transport system permease subunit I
MTSIVNRSRVRVPYPLGVVAFWVSVLVKWFGVSVLLSIRGFLGS